MSRRRSFRGGPKKAKAKKPSAGNMMAQMQAMQAEMEQAQLELEKETMDVTAGGGAIKVTISGHQRVQAIELDPDIVDPEDIEMLQDMLVAAVNLAIEKSQARSAERLEGVSGNAGIADMLGGLGL